MLERLYRKSGRPEVDCLADYCEHPECILAWNSAIFSLLMSRSPIQVAAWLRGRECDPAFPRRCCFRTDDQAMLVMAKSMN